MRASAQRTHTQTHTTVRKIDIAAAFFRIFGAINERQNTEKEERSDGDQALKKSEVKYDDNDNAHAIDSTCSGPIPSI